MHLELGDITLDVVQKDIKNIHLRVYPPDGRVRIAAPRRMNPEAIRAFVVSKVAWIRRQQQKLRNQVRETPREYIDCESHYVWGARCLLEVVEGDAPPQVTFAHGKLSLCVRPGTSRAERQTMVESWYREQLNQSVPALIAKWEPQMGVRVNRFIVQQMKTRWGSCTPATRNIRLNSELAKKPVECLEYVVVHEMAHLLEPSHNRRFVALMDQFVPSWKACRANLKHLPVRHEDWVC